jgi:Phage major capsid protein E
MLHADDLLRRNIGGNRNNGNATNRDAQMLIIDEQELDASISRTENWLCSQVLFVGKCLCLDGDTGKPVAEVDYGPISKTVLAKFWSDTTAKPLDDLKAAQRLVSGACGFTANLIVMGKDAGDAFESNPSVLESYNKLAIQSGTLAPEFEQFKIVLLGTWRGIPLYVSEEQYEHTDGTMKYYVPPKEVLVAATGIQGMMAYAGVAQVSEEGRGMEVYAGRRIPLVYWDQSGEDYRRLRLSSRPIPIPGNTDSWTVMQVLA